MNPIPGRYRRLQGHHRQVGLLAVLLVLLAAGCDNSRFDAPRIRSVSPEPDAVDVPTDVEIRVAFDKRMRASSLDAGNFYLWDVVADAAVAGQRSYEVENRTAVLRPDDPLLPDRRYRVVVDRDVRSERYGIRLRHSRLWEFTTAAPASAVLDEPGMQWQLQLLALQFEGLAAGLGNALGDASRELALSMSRAFVLAVTDAADADLATAIAGCLTDEACDGGSADRTTVSRRWANVLQMLSDRRREGRQQSAPRDDVPPGTRLSRQLGEREPR